MKRKIIGLSWFLFFRHLGFRLVAETARAEQLPGDTFERISLTGRLMLKFGKAQDSIV